MLSTRKCPWAAITGRKIAPDLHHSDIVNRVDLRETQFLRRSQFDEIQYGSAVLKRNARGAILRPVIAAHGHFRVLSILFPKVKVHVISHECFLRGGVITVWADLFRQRQAELWFIEEEINDSDSNIPWNFQGITQHGWWQGQWQLWAQKKNRKMVCSLTGGDSNNAETLSLTASRHFIHWLYQQTNFTHSAQLSAGRVTQLICDLAHDYNGKREINEQTAGVRNSIHFHWLCQSHTGPGAGHEKQKARLSFLKRAFIIWLLWLDSNQWHTD